MKPKTKPKTPYQRLLEDIREWCWKLQNLNKREMWTYPKGCLDEGWAPLRIVS